VRPLAGLLVVTLLLGAAPKPIPTATSSSNLHHENLAAIVTTALDGAPTNFKSLIGKRYEGTDDSEIKYRASDAFAKICSGCTFEDHFASVKTVEYWTMWIDWGGKWTIDDRTKFIIKTFSPLKKRFRSVKVGSTSEKETTIDFEGANGVWMYLETYGDDDSDRGLDVRVGHNLAKNVHLTPNTEPLTPERRTQFADAITNMVRTGLASAPDNFSSLLGKVHSDKDFHDANVSFGPMIQNPCDISAVLYTAAADKNMSKYIFECRTAEVGGEKADLLELVRSTVYRELPAGYVSDTDPAYLMGDDYRYDNHAGESVMIKLEDGSADRYYATISVYRWLGQ
jgi:hypothetical protein